MSPYNLGGLVSDVGEVPSGWAYKHFYKKLTGIKINQPFDGRIIKVKSVTNRDSDPSLCFFCKDGKYLWKDFSQGDAGGGFIKFVAFHFSKTEGAAVNIIVREYEEYLQNNTTYEEDEIDPNTLIKPEFKISYVAHNSTTLEYWGLYKIDLNTLNRYNVKNTYHYSIRRGDKLRDFRARAFTFYNKDGPYQIYQPNEKPKYLNINTDYLIGSEQLLFKSNVCIIMSGLKDIMAISQVGINAEFVAGFSENNLLSKSQIDWLRSKYEFIVTMLDNDKTGCLSMMRYKKVYGIEGVHIKIAKDAAENNVRQSVEYLRATYGYEINKKINLNV